MSDHLFVVCAGSKSKQSVLLLHGLLGSWRFWEELTQDLQESRYLIVPDLLGFGRSPKPRSSYTVTDHIRALELDVLPRIAGRFDIVGHSLGAHLAIVLAARHPQRVATVTCFALPYFKSSLHATTVLSSTPHGRFVLRRPLLARLMCWCVCRNRWLCAPLLGCCCRGDIPMHVFNDTMLHTYESFRLTLLNVVIGHRLDDDLNLLAVNRIPVRLLHASNDTTVPLDCVQDVPRSFANVTLEVVGGAFHTLHYGMFLWTDVLLRCKCLLQEGCNQCLADVCCCELNENGNAGKQSTWV